MVLHDGVDEALLLEDDHNQVRLALVLDLRIEIIEGILRILSIGKGRKV